MYRILYYNPKTDEVFTELSGNYHIVSKDGNFTKQTREYFPNSQHWNGSSPWINLKDNKIWIWEPDFEKRFFHQTLVKHKTNFLLEELKWITIAVVNILSNPKLSFLSRLYYKRELKITTKQIQKEILYLNKNIQRRFYE